MNHVNAEWQEYESSTHQDHVVAHVIGATALGYFQFDETLHLLLDIGFIWTIYLDGQMVLLPQSVAVSELELEAQTKAAIGTEVESLLTGSNDDLTHITAVNLTIGAVSFHEQGDRLRIVLSDGDCAITIEASIAERAFQIRL